MEFYYFMLLLVSGCTCTDVAYIQSMPVSQDLIKCMSIPGDVVIGYLTTIRGYGSGYDTCSSRIGSLDGIEYIESFRYAIEEINNRTDILPNVTLGYIVLDACERDLTALAQAMRFLPLNPDEGPVTTADCLGARGLVPVRVIGVVGPRTSRMSVMVSSVLGLFNIPVLSTFSTSDELSDRSRFPYFMRLVPPDRFQALAIADFLQYFNWTYVSLLYSEGSYGENGAKMIERQLTTYSICIAYSAMIPSDATHRQFSSVAAEVVAVPKVNVIIVFLSTYDGRAFFSAMEEYDDLSYIYIGGDDLQFEDYNHAANGMFTMHFRTKTPTDFYDYYNYLTPANNRENPWIIDLWRTLQCGDSDDTCIVDESIAYDNQLLSDTVTVAMDGVYVYAYALQNLMQNNCPGAFINKSQLTDCINGALLLKQMKNVEFRGRSSHIKFDDIGDMLGQYSISQYIYDRSPTKVQVALWDAETQRVEVNESAIDLRVYNIQLSESGFPQSVCSLPCPARSVQVYLHVICCWECRTCRQNEYITNQSCHTCPLTTWPDDVTGTSCLPIPATYVHWTDPIAMVILLVSILGIIFIAIIIAVYAKNWNLRLLKASTRELSIMTLAGTLMAYITAILFISSPSGAICGTQIYGFNLAVTVIYAPLLIKTNRICRIFNSGKKGDKKVKFIDTRIQIVFCLTLIFMQILLLIIVGIQSPVRARLRMPVETQYQVELYCDVSLPGMMIPMAYNLVLITLTAVHGFLTRKYPANFNESSHIFISVTTTTFLWAVFLPTYLTAFYAYHQVVVLAFCLLLNATITLLCLYLPNIYAVYFVEEGRHGVENSTEVQYAYSIHSAFQNIVAHLAMRRQR